MVSTMIGFISSEGWSRMIPRSSQRWLPPATAPNASTPSSISRMTPYIGKVAWAQAPSGTRDRAIAMPKKTKNFVPCENAQG